MTTKRKGPIGRLPDDLDILLTEYATKNGYSKNTVIIMALRNFLQTDTQPDLSKTG